MTGLCVPPFPPRLIKVTVDASGVFFPCSRERPEDGLALSRL